MAIIRIARVGTKEQAQSFSNAIDGKTYMDFRVIVAPSCGEYQVSVQTDYTDDESEAQGMLNMVMFNAIETLAINDR